MTVEELLKGRSEEAKRVIVGEILKEIERRKRENPLKYLLADLQPKQRLLLETLENFEGKWVGFGGARGGGKSGAIRKIMYYRRLKYAGSVGVILRKTLNDLQDNHITPFFDEYPHLRSGYNVQQKCLTLSNGSKILFRHEENEAELIETFQGKNYDDIFADEATHNSQRALIAIANSCRTVRTDMRSKFLLSMNPGGRSHSFIKRIFIDKKYVDNEIKENYTYIQAYGWDNVQWVKVALAKDGFGLDEFYSWDDDKRFDYFVNRSDYGRDLNTLNSNDRKAHLFGDWYVFAGQFFSMWTSKNVIDSFQLQDGMSVVGGLDYGQRTVLEVGARDCEGNITVFAECYTERKTPSERALKIAEMLIEQQLWNLKIVYDTNMNINLEHYTGYDKTPIQIFRDTIEEKFKQEGLEGKEPRFIVVSKHTTNKYGYRVACNEAFKDMLLNCKIKFVLDCKYAIQTIPELVYDEKDKHGMDFDEKSGVDDPYDAVKYMMMDLRVPYASKPIKKYENEFEHIDNEIFKKIINRANARIRSELI